MATSKRTVELRGGETPGVAVPGPLLDASNMDDLRRLQLAHEGMRLLLSSEVKKAEQLFRRSRCVHTPELNIALVCRFSIVL